MSVTSSIGDWFAQKRNLLVFGLFVVYFILGLFIFKDYGISWDETIQRQHGWVTLDYLDELVGKDGSRTEYQLKDYNFRAHGTFFQLTAHALGSVLGLNSEREQFLLRHFMVFILFFLSAIAFFSILKKRFEHDWIPFIGLGMYVLMPRIFAHSFYNPKDLVFLSLFTLSIYGLFRFSENKSVRNAILLAALTSLAINSRILGILLPALTILFFLLEYLTRKKKAAYLKKLRRPIIAYLLSLVLITIAIWPYLWSNPVSNFIHVFEFMSKHFWETDVLYYGGLVKSTDLPWHYVFGWILVTTPILYLILITAGIILILWRHLRNIPSLFSFYYKRQNRQDLVVMLWFWLPLLAVIILGSTMYDGWRHNYFVYPAMVYFGSMIISLILDKAQGLNKKNPVAYRYLPLGIALLLFAPVLMKMVSLHPYQNTYFNILAGKGEKLDKNFEQEYWGLSCKESLEFLVNTIPEGDIKIFASADPVGFNLSLLSEKDRMRMKSVSFEEADYFIYHHRFEFAKKQYYDKVWPFTNELFTVKANDITISGVYSMKDR